MLDLFLYSLPFFFPTGVLVVLDACPDGIIYEDLIPDYAHYVRTLYEGILPLSLPFKSFVKQL